METDIKLRTVLETVLLNKSFLNLEFYKNRSSIIDDIMSVLEQQSENDWLELDTGQTYQLSFKPSEK